MRRVSRRLRHVSRAVLAVAAAAFLSSTSTVYLSLASRSLTSLYLPLSRSLSHSIPHSLSRSLSISLSLYRTISVSAGNCGGVGAACLPWVAACLSCRACWCCCGFPPLDVEASSSVLRTCSERHPAACAQPRCSLVFIECLKPNPNFCCGRGSNSQTLSNETFFVQPFE